MTSMNIARALSVFAGALLLAAACVTSEQTSPQSQAASLAGTSWRLVQFKGGDGQILTPDDRSKYTFQFNSDGSLVVRLDCGLSAARACFMDRNALPCNALHLEDAMALPAERMKAMRERRSVRGLRELRLIVPDARSKAVRRRVAKEVAGLDRSRELEALRWIEAVSVFDDR